MKKTLYFIGFIFLSIQVLASTNITNGTISGHWTQTGSPYLIFTNITIPYATTLVIDSGVDVIFQGNYHLEVNGSLNAAGTAAKPINFHIQDTTGWSDPTSSSGGWNGITIENTSLVSVMQHCNLYDMKQYGLIVNGITMTLSNCTIFHNNGMLLDIYYTDSTHSFEMDGCNIHHNIFNNPNPAPIMVFSSGNVHIHNSGIYNNTCPSDLMQLNTLNILFENNEVYNNTETDTSLDATTLDLFTCHGTIRENKIHHNTATNMSPISCYWGKITIDANLMCNNQSLNGFSGGSACGHTQGGGAIRLTGDGDATKSTYFVVRNNIIANNAADYEGGGVYVFMTSAEITNNQIVNNYGAGIYVFQDTFLEHTMVKIKNNLFYNNVGSGYFNCPDTVAVFIQVGDTLEYDHNWMQHPLYIDFYSPQGSHFVTDTTTNVIGINPGMIAPTLSANVTDNAVNADFGLLSTSPCIDKGDTTGIRISSVDYAGNSRIHNGIIDIGAYEYYTSNTNVSTYYASTEQIIKTYPNPADKLLFVSTPEAIGTIMLQDIWGRVLCNKPVSATQNCLDVHEIPRGIYFAIWDNGNGSKAVQKILLH